MAAVKELLRAENDLEIIRSRQKQRRRILSLRAISIK